MLSFKSVNDLNQLDPNDPAYPAIKELVDLLIVAYDMPENPYCPDADGYILLIEQGDVDRVLDDIPVLQCKLVDIPWEGAYVHQGYFNAIYLKDDQYGLSILIPNMPWVNGKLRSLLDELVAC